MIRITAFALGALLLAGCQTMAGSQEEAYEPGVIAGERGPQAGGDGNGDGSPSCAAAAYQVLVGQPISEVHADSLPSPHRIYARGDMVTMDYRPERLNVVTGDDGTVVEVKCG